jgi:ATP-dependent Clp protease ATP-binding subunit ClpA
VCSSDLYNVAQSLENEIKSRIGITANSKQEWKLIRFSKEVEQILDNAKKIALSHKNNMVSPIHILSSILKSANHPLIEMLERNQVTSLLIEKELELDEEYDENLGPTLT